MNRFPYNNSPTWSNGGGQQRYQSPMPQHQGGDSGFSPGFSPRQYQSDGSSSADMHPRGRFQPQRSPMHHQGGNPNFDLGQYVGAISPGNMYPPRAGSPHARWPHMNSPRPPRTPCFNQSSSYSPSNYSNPGSDMSLPYAESDSRSPFTFGSSRSDVSYNETSSVHPNSAHNNELGIVRNFNRKRPSPSDEFNPKSNKVNKM